MGLFRENKMNRLKGIMGILLSLVLVVGMIPALPARAEEEGPVGSGINIGSMTTLDLGSDGHLVSNNTEYCEVRVTDGDKVILDLNGHTLWGHITVIGDNTIKTELTIVDTSSTGGGQIYGDINLSNSGVTIYPNCKFTMNGGTITNHIIGVDVQTNDGTFIMNNGTISGNGNSGINDYNRGVRNNKGTFTMTGGKITGNDGGVYNSGTFTMTGGSIESNSLKAYNSKKSIGGGLYNDGNFVMEGGNITGNSDDDVYMKTGVMSVSKDINVGTLLLDTSNPASGDSPKVTLDGPLKNTNKITIKQTGKLNSYTFTQKSATGPNPADYIECFTPYDASKEIGYSGNELVLADAAMPPTISGTSDDISLETGYESKNQLSVSATAAGDHELSYQWYSNTTDSNTGGTKIDGATSATYNLPTGLTAGNKYYYCVVTSTNTTTHVKSSLASRAIKVSVISADERYENSEGENATWNPNSGSPLRFIFKTTTGTDDIFKRFTGIEVDGKAVPEKDLKGETNWTAGKGSLIIDLQPGFLKTLDAGDHTLSVVFDDGSKITTSFSIAQLPEVLNETTTAPNTGEGRDFTVYIALLLMYIAMVMTAAVGGTKAIEYSQRRKKY